MRRGLAALGFLLAAAGPACADPYDYVATPYIDKGKVNLRLSWGIQDDREHSASGQAVWAGYSPTDWWYTEFWAAQERSGGDPLAYDGWYWTNQFKLLGSGPHDLDLYVSYWKPAPGTGGWNWTIGPMWQYAAQSFDFNFNLFVNRWVHPSFRQPPAKVNYQSQIKTLLRPGWEWGAQMYGELGALSNPYAWRRQTHELGPALFGHQATGSGGVWRYDAALLFGLNSASPRALLRAQLGYQF